MFTNMHEYPDYQRPRIAQFTVRSFQVFPEEDEHLDHLRKFIFKYMVIKEAKTDELELPGLSSFLSAAYNDCVEQSNVVYVDIVSLPADSKDTVLHVLTITSEAELEDFQKHMNTVFNTTLSNFSAGFHSFVETLCSHQQTCQFWYEYITVNSLVYMALFIAIRNGDWVLRMTAIKLMAAVFSAFDRPIYQRLVPQHLADLLCFPAPILQHLQKGAISVRLTKSRGHTVGLDEAHEMKINKDAKFSVVRPSKELMEKISNFMPFRSKCLNNLKHHLAMDEKTPKTLPVSTSRDRTAEGNIQSMLDLMEECDMLPTSPDNLGLLNNLSNTPATPEQAHDLLTFRKIGQAEFEAHVNYRILRTPSTDAPRRRKRLQTFTSTKATRKKLKQIDRDRKIQQMCMKKQLVMLARGKQLPQDCGSNFIPRPCALVAADGVPTKGNKSKATDFFETCYKQVGVIVSAFPNSWTPDSVILEGMFMVQTAPSPGITTFQQYTDMLLKRFTVPHLKAGTKEVHILFDDPDQTESPKEIERQVRDHTYCIDSDHHCSSIEPLTAVPTEWSNLLNCRKCKRALCVFLSNDMLIQAPKLLRENQTLITAGGFVGQPRSLCWSVQKDGSVQPLPYLRSNAEETDLRIWLHCTRSAGSRKMLYSPDTDIYHIGLPIVSRQLPHPDVYIQLHGRRKDSHRYLQVSAFLQAIDSDPDLAQVPPNKRANVVQMAYVATGCDYISYFKGIGEVFFLNVLYQHATFITGSSDPVGTLADIHPDC